MSDEKDKKMKEQVELLKQKYLKKKPVPPPAPSSVIQNSETPKDPIKIQSQHKVTESIKFHVETQGPKGGEQTQQMVKGQKSNTSINNEGQMKENKKGKDTWRLKNLLEELSENEVRDKKVSGSKQFYEIENNDSRDPFQLKLFSLKPRVQEEGLDEEFEAQAEVHESQLQVKKRRRQISEKQIEEACRLWGKSIPSALEYLLFEENKLNQQQQELVLASRNPSFPGIVENLAKQFIFKNPYPLTENQKSVVYEMALTYFSPSPSILSDVLLLSIIKIGGRCLDIYSTQILSKVGYYFERIVALRNHLLDQEIDSFVLFLEEKLEGQRKEGNFVNSVNYIYALSLKPTSVYLHQIMMTINFTKLELFAIFCIVEPTLSDLGLSLLYLKCVDELAGTFSENKIIEKVVTHFNKIKVPESLYKQMKALKLKLIHFSDSKVGSKKITEDEKGLMRFFNEKMGKLKDKFEIQIKGKQQVFFDASIGEYRVEQPSVPNKNF